MKIFAINLLPYIIALISVSFVGWDQKQNHAPEGDLIRMGFLRSLHQYENKADRTENDEIDATTFIFGDSFLIQDDSSTYSRHLDTPTHDFCWFEQYFAAHSASIFNLAFEFNPDSTKINHIIFEAIERTISKHAEKTLEQSREQTHTANRHLIQNKETSNWYRHYPNGLRSIAAMIGVQSHFLQNNECLITRSHRHLPLHNKHNLLSISNTQKLRKSPDEIFNQLERLKPILDSISHLHNAEYLLFVIPDKISVYEDFLPSEAIPKPSFLNDPRLDEFPWVVSPLNQLRTAAEQGEMELFKYSDTHFGPAGAAIAAERLQKAIDSRGW